MPETIQERLYGLLPALYRIRDEEQNRYALRAFLALIEHEVDAIHDDIDGLYENWFIETCDEWVVPYHGDLLGVTPLRPIENDVYSARAYVANTLAYRQAKGTLALLEALAHDVTGHTARAVEFFRRLATAPNLNHLRPGVTTTPDLRNTAGLDLLGTPFDPSYRTVEVRRIAAGRGRHNVPNIGIFLWRLQSYPLTGVTARAVNDDGFTFNVFGHDAALFNRPDTEESLTGLAEERHVPTPLRRRALYDDLGALRSRLDGLPPGEIAEATAAWQARSPFFEPGRAALAVEVQRTEGGPFESIALHDVEVCTLTSWRRPPALGVPTDAFTVMVDPVLGRLTVPEDETPAAVRVSYACGFSADLGSGPYDREEEVAAMLLAALPPSTDDLAERIDWQIGVSQTASPAGDETIVPTLTEAVQRWNDQDPGTTGVIVLMDSATYEEDIDGADRLRIPEDSTLLILAGDWTLRTPDDAPPERRRGEWDASAVRPHLLGDLSVRGTAPPGSDEPGRLLLSGLALEGELRVLVGHLGRLHLSHCTIVADHTSQEMRPSVLEINPSVNVNQQNNRLEIILESCICGPVGLAETVPTLRLQNTILDVNLGELFNDTPPADPEAIVWDPETVLSAPGSRVQIDACTFFGATDAYHLDANDTLFVGALTTRRRQIGCVRYSYVSPEALTPPRYRCQPDGETAARLEEAEKAALAAAETLTEEQADAIRARTAMEIVPRFTARRFGRPAYAQLQNSTPSALRRGSEAGGEMGAFGHLALTQREDNLRTVLDEYLRLGLEVGLLYAT